MSIKQKLINGAIWNTISQVLSQVINFVTTIILARLLTPQDFGLIGQVAVITGLVSFLSEFGFMPSLIQKKNIDDKDLNTAFYGTIIFSIVIYFTVYMSAPLVGKFYNNNEHVLITRVIFIQFLFAPFGFINDLLEYKRLDFKKIIISDLLSILISGIAGILMAYSGYGVWSLVWQGNIRTISKVIIIVLITTWRPKLIFSFQVFLELTKSGAHFTYRNLTLYITENIDFLLVGKIAGATTLGVYNIAFRMSNYPFTKVQQILGKMLFPAFTMLREDIQKVTHNYLKISLIGAFILLPSLIFIFFGTDLIVKLLLGEKWLQAIDVVRILVIYLFFSSISFADDAIMLALNKVKILNIAKTIMFILLLIFGFIFTKKYGAIGMASVFSVFSILYIVTIKTLLLKQLDISIFSFLLNFKDIIILLVILIIAYSCFELFIFKLITDLLIQLFLMGLTLLVFMILFLIQKKVINIKSRSINPGALERH